MVLLVKKKREIKGGRSKTNKRIFEKEVEVIDQFDEKEAMYLD